MPFTYRTKHYYGSPRSGSRCVCMSCSSPRPPATRPVSASWRTRPAGRVNRSGAVFSLV